MFELRNKNGEMKAQLSTRVALEVTRSMHGKWRNYRTTDYHTQAFEITGDFIQTLRAGTEYEVRLWFCDGDVLVDRDNCTTIAPARIGVTG